MSTFDTIREIFYSGNHSFNGDRESINEIAFLVDEKYLLVKSTIIATKEEYFSILKDSSSNVVQNRHRAAGGSFEHVALKLLSGIYIKKERNYLDILYEHPFCGYFPDVITKDEKIIVECGHTQNAEKLLTYFRQGKIKECIQVPYPSDEDKTIKGYSFTASNDLTKFLIFLEQEKRNELKTILINRK